MGDPVRMKMEKSFGDLVEYFLNGVFIEKKEAVPKVVMKGGSIKVFEDDMNLSFVFVGLMKFDDVWMRGYFGKKLDLSFNSFLLLGLN